MARVDIVGGLCCCCCCCCCCAIPLPLLLLPSAEVVVVGEVGPNMKSAKDFVILSIDNGDDEDCCFPPPPLEEVEAPLPTTTGGGGGGVAHMLNTHKCNGKHPWRLSRSLHASGCNRIKVRIHLHASMYSSSSIMDDFL